MNLKTSILSLILLVLNTLFLQAQGCSDAGFCTINSFKPPTTTDSVLAKPSKNQIKIGMSYGKADHNITILANYIEYNRIITEKLGLDFKLTSIAQLGSNAQVFGVSDAFVNANYALTKNFKATLGAKIPLNLGNKTSHNIALPMDYQSSLGTVDLIAGLGYEIKKIQFVAAIQQPLSQNKNAFLSNYSMADTMFAQFQSTNKFKRAGDVLLRISYPINIGNHLKITPSLLGIYHLAKDKFTDNYNVQQTIAGSDGLTLNATGYIDYTINNQHALQLNAGVPFVVRKIRPDGLTRSFILTLEYRFRF